VARSRNIKPGFFMNDELGEIEPLGRILFIGLWTIADREGRLEDRPKRIRAEILPFDNCDVDMLLNALHEKEFITRYSVDKSSYIQITNFSKHQNPHPKEAASSIPEMESRENKLQVSDKPIAKNADSLLLISDSLQSDSLLLITDAEQKKTKDVIKDVFGEKVHLTQSEYQKLISEHGEDGTGQMIAILDNYYLTKGKKPYKSDYHTMVGAGWVLAKYKDSQQRPRGKLQLAQVPKSWSSLQEWADERTDLD
jgi:hypothetical protein